jgi:hypothetical protein
MVMKKILFIFFYLSLGVRCAKEKIPHDDNADRVTFTVPVISKVAATVVNVEVTISSGGNREIIERGVCWDTATAPTIGKNRTINGSGTGRFTAEVTGLMGGTNYYLRPYGKTSNEIIYGEEVIFKTLSLPAIVTSPATNITQSSAVLNANLTSDGGLLVKERGFCWDTIANPDTGRFKKAVLPFTTGSFSSSIDGLQAGRKYYVAAYAITDAGVAYGNEVSFITPTLPVIITTPLSSITETSVMTGGNVISQGGDSVRSMGVCWGTSPIPTIGGPGQDPGSGPGAFTFLITGLNPNTTYYVRAYAANSAGISYGEVHTFKTLPAPVVTTKTAGSFTPFSAATGGTVTTNGGPILEKGICWSTGSIQIPTVNNTKISAGPGTGTFNTTINGLRPITWYYARAYAITAGGVFYGAVTNIFTEGDFFSTPILFSPANAALAGCCQVNFSWSWDGNFNYEIQISKSSDFSGTITSGVFTCTSGTLLSTGVNSVTSLSTSLCVKMDNPSFNGTWYWRVRHRDSNTGPWSEVRSFSYQH